LVSADHIEVQWALDREITGVGLKLHTCIVYLYVIIL